MVLEIWDVVRIDETDETGIVIGEVGFGDPRIRVSMRERTVLVSRFGLTRLL